MFAFYLPTALFETTEKQFTQERRDVLSPSTLPRFTEEQQTTIKEADNLSLQQDRKFYEPLAVSDELHSLPSSNSKYLINVFDSSDAKHDYGLLGRRAVYFGRQIPTFHADIPLLLCSSVPFTPTQARKHKYWSFYSNSESILLADPANKRKVKFSPVQAMMERGGGKKKYSSTPSKPRH